MGRRAEAAAAAVLAAEAFGTLLLWAPLPFAWIWVGGRAYALTGSLFADGAVALLGFAVSAFLAVRVSIFSSGEIPLSLSGTVRISRPRRRPTAPTSACIRPID